MDDQVMLFSHEAGDMDCRSWSLNGVSASIFLTRKTANQEALRAQQSKSNQSAARKIL